LKWAVFDPALGTFGHGDLTGVPLEEGFGVPFSPFFDARGIDSRYCLMLDDWWRRVKEMRAAEMGTVHQIGGGSAYVPSSGRPHKLMSDIPLLLDTDLYVDMTVEVSNAPICMSLLCLLLDFIGCP
jgi:hypothetical protein